MAANDSYCRGPALAGSRGYPQDEQCRQEKIRETRLDRTKTARERKRERERDKMGGAAKSGNALFFTVAFIF